MVLSPTQSTDAFPASEPIGLRKDSFSRRLLRHPLAIIGCFIVILLIFVACFTPWLAPKNHFGGVSSPPKAGEQAFFSGLLPTDRIDPDAILPNGIDSLGRPHSPGNGFLLGADTLGRDIWTRTLYGTRVSLIVAVIAMATATTIGTLIGLLGGYFGGKIDLVLTRLTETIQSLPTILLAMALYQVLPADTPFERMRNLLIAIAIVTWTGIARAVRGQVLSLKEQEFIEAASAIGCSHLRIIGMHLLPNVLPTVIVLATLATANNILLEAGLSYLGLGIDPAQPSWGNMISDGQPYMLFAPWILMAPGVAIVVAVAGFNMLGQGLQETLETRA